MAEQAERKSKMEPCPFCGRNDLDVTHDDPGGPYFVTCNWCEARGPLASGNGSDSHLSVVRRDWNRRKMTKSQPAPEPPKTTVEPQCGTCEFWRSSGGNDPKGYCRRYPPPVVTLGSQVIFSSPCTDSDYWCGEHKEKADG